ncbi:MAG: ACT domain-containing protein [Myxococcota bacterium]
MRTLVLTVIGRDRTGLVEELAETIAGHGGSWDESRMARLAGHFAGVVQIQLPPERADALIADLPGLSARGLAASVVESDASDRFEATDPTLWLELVGQDRPGIVRDVSRALAALSVNVLDLWTSVESAPMSGERLFRARAELAPPSGLPRDSIRRTLERLAADMMVDLTLGDAPIED